MTHVSFHELAACDAAQRAALFRRSEADLSSFLERVKPILEAVRTQGDAALVRFARELDGAVIVNPYDLRSVSQAIEAALAMPLDERQARHTAMLAALRSRDLRAWHTGFLAALSAAARR